MTAALKARIARLEAKRCKDLNRVVGVIGGPFNGSCVEEIDGVLFLRREEPPGGFAEYARKQQSELQAELSHLLADTTH